VAAGQQGGCSRKSGSCSACGDWKGPLVYVGSASL
jgi:hypothetical protein